MPRTPRQPRAKATVNAIVEAGFLSLSEHGVQGTTTRHIADLAGVSVGSLYEYFANKEEVFEAMHHHMVAEVVAMVEPMTPALVRMEIRDLIKELLFGFRDLLEKNWRSRIVRMPTRQRRVTWQRQQRKKEMKWWKEARILLAWKLR